MKKLYVTFKCIDGGHGWGSTGSEVTIVFSETNLTDAEYLRHAPGGWIIHEKELK